MRVGIANPFAYRPHVAHMVFLHRQLLRLGHQTFFLGCGGGLDNCNSRVIKAGLAHRLECLKCRAGSIRSYMDVEVGRIDRDVSLSEAQIDAGRQWSFSTACTALQVEHERETGRADFADMQRRLAASTARAHANTRTWIRDNKLDTVFVFNGRFDMTRAILEACVRESVRFVSVERSWFGDGLQLLPQENCLGLKSFQRLSAHWAGKPLTYQQALKASGVITARLNRTSKGEWRQYNINTRVQYARETIEHLFLPSSQHEWLGDTDRANGWQHPTDGLEYLFKRCGLDPAKLVVRGHPGWAMQIKNYGANRANDFYRDWTRRVGGEYIEPSADVDTHGLIRRADLVLLNGSSASMEAAWLGKPLVSLVPAAFSASGISLNVHSHEDVDRLTESEVRALRGSGQEDTGVRALQCQRALRFIYCANFRLMQFVDSMKSTGPLSFIAGDPAELGGLDALVTAGELHESDAAWATDELGERQVVDAILAGDIASLQARPGETQDSDLAPIRRRAAYRLVDALSTAE
jgi:hypothetical protein